MGCENPFSIELLVIDVEVVELIGVLSACDPGLSWLGGRDSGPNPESPITNPL